MGVFAFVGVICSLVAIMQIARTGAFTSRAADGWELKAIAAAVVGGTSLTGGIGSMAGIFWGALTISLIENALVVMRDSLLLDLHRVRDRHRGLRRAERVHRAEEIRHREGNVTGPAGDPATKRPYLPMANPADMLTRRLPIG